MDETTVELVETLKERAMIREMLAASDARLKGALRAWSDARPGERGGIATEAGAGFILRRAGLL